MSSCIVLYASVLYYCEACCGSCEEFEINKVIIIVIIIIIITLPFLTSGSSPLTFVPFQAVHWTEQLVLKPYIGRVLLDLDIQPKTLAGALPVQDSATTDIFYTKLANLTSELKSADLC